MLDGFAESRITAAARKRIATSVFASTVLYGGLAGAVVATTAVVSGGNANEDELIEVEFAEEPEPEAAPPPPEPVKAVAKVAPRRRNLVAPDSLPLAHAEESDGALAEVDAAGAGEEVEEAAPEAAAPVATAAPAATSAPATARPRVVRSGPVQLPENGTPPVADPGNRAPAYPESARASGKTDTVIAKVVVTVSGSVASVEIMRGDPIFHDSVRSALMGWRFSPATLDGRPISVYRIIRIPFRLNNM